MSQLTIEYKNDKPEFLIINGQKLNRFDLLAAASRTDDKNYAWEIMQLASKLFHWQDDKTFNALYGSVAIEITVFNKENEFSIHQKFNEQVKELLGNNAQIVKRINDIHHQPDSWVELNGKHIPVEMKRDKFNQKALNQLLRYMYFYNCESGIAVGTELTIQIPDGIKFISTKQLR